MTPMTPKERGEMERRSKRREGLLRGKYPEVHGKVVDFITHTIDDGMLYFTVRFTDQTSFCVATLAGISERRTEQMTNPQSSQLPAFLVANAGLHSDFMILHVAAAALASETKAMAMPHSVDSIPTSANQDDYVSRHRKAQLGR
jgi:hypothetical protein